MQENQHIQTDPLKDFERLDTVSRKYQGKLTATQLKWLSRYRHENGLSKCGAVVVVSGKTYVNISKFAEWFSKQTN